MPVALPGAGPDRRPAGRARRLQRGARRQAILAAAIDVFAERGFAEATMDEIAERSGSGKGTLYNYFEDKRHLLEAACDEATDGLVALVERYFADAPGERGTARSTLHGFISILTSYFAEHHAVLVVQIREAQLAFGGRGQTAFLARLRDRVATALEGPLEEAMRRGDMRPLPARRVANLIVANVQAYLMGNACSAGGAVADDVPAETADFLVAVLFDGLRAETP